MTDTNVSSPAHQAPPRVDCHAHLYTVDMPQAEGAWHRPPRDATLEDYLGTLDAHGVGFAVLAAASIYGDYNDYHVEALRRHRRRLRSTIIAHPGIDRFFLERMDAEGVVGIRLQWRYLPALPNLTAPDYRLLLRRVADLGWHVHLHDNSPRLQETLERLEAAGVAKIVVDHFGRPDPARGVQCPGFQALLRAVDRGRTWVKLSAGYRLESVEACAAYAGALLAAGGPERLVWGSDWPFAAFEDRVTYQSTLDDFKRWVPDAQTRRIIGGETAYELYFT